jgi:hypothetical protein
MRLVQTQEQSNIDVCVFIPVADCEKVPYLVERALRPLRQLQGVLLDHPLQLFDPPHVLSKL